MIRFLLLSLPLLFLVACNGLPGSRTQDMTIETPGTDGALCFLERSGFRRRVWAPKTVRITKSYEPLHVRCLAPGNREKTVIVEPMGVGLILPEMNELDFLGTYYSFPEKVIVDFTDMLPTRMPDPTYQRVLDENPNIADMEEFRPGIPALQSDRYRSQPRLQERRSQADLFSGGALTEIRSRDESGDKVGASSAGDDNPGFMGGNPVLGSDAEATGTLDGSSILESSDTGTLDGTSILESAPMAAPSGSIPDLIIPSPSTEGAMDASPVGSDE